LTYLPGVVGKSLGFSVVEERCKNACGNGNANPLYTPRSETEATAQRRKSNTKKGKEGEVLESKSN